MPGLVFLLIIALAGALVALWLEHRPGRELRSGVTEILKTYEERLKDPVRKSFPVRPAVVNGFRRDIYNVLARMFRRSGVNLEARKDFHAEVMSAASSLAHALADDTVEQVKTHQFAG